MSDLCFLTLTRGGFLTPLIIPKFAIRNPKFRLLHAPCAMLHAFFISARPAILPSNSRMISDEITQRFTAITLIFNPIAFIVGIMPLRALYAIAGVLGGEPHMVCRLF
jgi:hypothetical protein